MKHLKAHKHTVAPQETPDTVAPQETPDTVAPQETLDTVAPQETLDTVAPQETPVAPQVHTVAPEETPDTVAPQDTRDTVAPQETPVAPQVKPVAPPIQPPKLPTIKGKKIEVTCPHCKLQLNKKNFKTHLRRMHTHSFETVSKEKYLACECIDPKNGVFAVEKSFSGPSTPIHVIKNTWGATQKILCEVDQCQLNADFAVRCGMLPFECQHLKSLLYCPRSENTPVILSEEALTKMVDNRWFGEERKTRLLQLQKKADADGVPLSVHLTVGGPAEKYHISVYEPKVSYYSRLGRIVVGYDSKKNSWHCPCSKARQSCLHKAISKWHLFHTKRHLFKRLKSTDLEGTISPQHTTDQDASQANEGNYPPTEKGVQRMLKYLTANKNLPAELPQAVIQQSRDAHILDGFPKHLIPKETRCKECDAILGDPVLITAKGRILSNTGVVEGQ